MHRHLIFCAIMVTLVAVVYAATTTAATTKNGTTAASATTKGGTTTTAGATTKGGATTASATTKRVTTTAGATSKGVTTTAGNATSEGSTTASPTTSEQAAVVAANQVPVPEKQCVFPFYHNKGWQHACVQYDQVNDYWCSLTTNFTEDQDWKRCSSHDIKRFQCKIPFTYQGKSHNKCIPFSSNSKAGASSHNSYWCSLVEHLGNFSMKSTDWAYCESDIATNSQFLVQVGSARHPSSANTEALENAAKNPGAQANTGSTGSASAGAIGAQAAVGIAVGTICALLAVVAVVSGFIYRKRKRRGQRLLPTEDTHYGGTN